MISKPKRLDVWLADLSPRFGTESGKPRPVVVLQTDALNKVHPSTLICPITSKVLPESKLLRAHIPKGVAGLEKDSDIMIDQLRAIDNRRLLKKLGVIPKALGDQLSQNLKIVLDLDF